MMSPCPFVHSPEELRKSVVPKAGGWKHEIDVNMIYIYIYLYVHICIYIYINRPNAQELMFTHVKDSEYLELLSHSVFSSHLQDDEQQLSAAFPGSTDVSQHLRSPDGVCFRLAEWDGLSENSQLCKMSRNVCDDQIRRF